METSWSENLDQTKELKIIKQKVPNGYIINSNIFLNECQWHTLVKIDDLNIKCAVCNFVCLFNNYSEHISSENHMSTLDICKPLQEFELSIIRKIKSSHHCAVCNEVFNDLTVHLETKIHQENFLFAFNKASDVMYDLDVHFSNNDTKKVNNNDAYHFDAEAVYRDDDSLDDHFGNGVGNGNDDRYQLDDSDIEAYSDDCFTEDGFWDDADEIEPIVKKGSSYATMARKAKAIVIPKVIEKNLDGKTVKVNADSWHMIVMLKLNKYYCYACKAMDHVKFKAQHCDDSTHLVNINDCVIVDTFPGYFVRKVDSTFYHCGHCNRIQKVSDMKEHLDKTHPKKYRNFTESINPKSKISKIPHNNTKVNKKRLNSESSVSSDVKTDKKSDMDVAPNIKTEKNNNLDMVTKGKLEKKTDIISKPVPLNPDINDDIIIVPFNYTLKVKFLAFNIVFEAKNGVFCGLCNVFLLGDDISKHCLFNSQHIHLLQTTLFIEEFSCNLIRYIRPVFHCTICNVPLNVDIVQTHVRELNHIIKLVEALGMDIKPDGASGEKPVAMTTGVHEAPKHNVLLCEDVEDSLLKGAKQEINDKKTVKEEIKKEEISLTDVCTVIEVKNNKNKKRKGSAISQEDNFQDLEESDDIDFDYEEMICVVLNKRIKKISNSSYNTMVNIGDGTRYCFVCSTKVFNKKVGKHIDGRTHMDNVKKYLFLDNYEDHLFRQIFLHYHCAICNVIFPRQYLKMHVDWPLHVEGVKNRKITKKQKLGLHTVIAYMEKEKIYLNSIEPKINVKFNYRIIPQDVNFKNDVPIQIDRKRKIIMSDDTVYKVSWENWHSFIQVKDSDGFKCQMCQAGVGLNDVISHIDSHWHVKTQEEFELKFAPDLFRKISETQYNCVICNLELSLTDIEHHIVGKRHVKFSNLLKETSCDDNYEDCSSDVFYI